MESKAKYNLCLKYLNNICTFSTPEKIIHFIWTIPSQEPNWFSFFSYLHVLC